jgi:hypothetical protein
MQWRLMEEWRYSSTLLDLGTRWKWVVSFRPLPLYIRGKNTRYSLDRRVGAPQSQSACWEEKNLGPSGNRTLAIKPVACRYTNWDIKHTATVHMYLCWSLASAPDLYWRRNRLEIPVSSIVPCKCYDDDLKQTTICSFPTHSLYLSVLSVEPN